MTAVLKASRDRNMETEKRSIANAWATANWLGASGLPDLETVLGGIGDGSTRPTRRAMSDAEIGHNIALWGMALDHQYSNEGTGHGG